MQSVSVHSPALRAGASSPAGSGWVRAGPASARGSARQERREPGRTGPSPHGRPEQPRGGRGRAGPASREPASGGPGLAAALGSRRGAKGAAAKLTTLAALSPEKQRLKQSPSPAALPGCDSVKISYETKKDFKEEWHLFQALKDKEDFSKQRKRKEDGTRATSTLCTSGRCRANSSCSTETRVKRSSRIPAGQDPSDVRREVVLDSPRTIFRMLFPN
ncbi:hypothetical protein R6Z07M_001983 [Ovis aries]